jgi:hypothetical protein
VQSRSARVAVFGVFGAGLPTPPKRPTEGLLFSASNPAQTSSSNSAFAQRRPALNKAPRGTVAYREAERWIEQEF